MNHKNSSMKNKSAMTIANKDNLTDDAVAKKAKFLNPYEMFPSKVRHHHFRDARIYDSDAPAGFRVPRWQARKMYYEWLRAIRRIPEWKNFRRYSEFSIAIEKDDDTIKKSKTKRDINQSTPAKLKTEKSTRTNKNSKLVAQSIDKRINKDDQDFRPKMFTEKMGREISRLRNELGLKQNELAMKINVDSNMIRNIEIGGLISFNPQDSMVRALARALGVPSIKYEE